MLTGTSSQGVYNALYILIAIMTVLGTSGLYGLYRWAKAQGVRDSKLDRVITVVLPDSSGNGGLDNRLSAQDRKLDAIEREQTPNGGVSRRLGDTVIRVERKVDSLSTRLDKRIGAAGAFEKRTDERLDRLEKR